MRKVQVLVVSLALLAASFFAAPSGVADSLTVLTPPSISLIKIGGSISATPAIWSAAVKSSAVWLVNGKVVVGKGGKSFTPPNKKGTTIVFRESAQGIIAQSNSIVIGNVAANGFPTITFGDTAKTTMSVKLPTTTPVNAAVTYQWFSGPFEVKGAHSATYQVATGDQGSDISVKVSFTAKSIGATSVTSNSITIPISPRNYSLIWSEEFNAGTSINSNIWTPENGDGTAYKNRGWGNQERQWYLDSQSTIDSTGALVITATRDGAGANSCYYGTPCEWVSSKFVTKNKVGFKYGRVEVRMKGPVGAGTWAAFWMLGANIDDRPWPGCGEIDVTELLGRDPSTNYGTPHGPASGQSYTVTMDKGFGDDYHVYAVDWLPDQITWYVDGKAFGTLNKSSLSDPSHTWVFDHEYYLIINLAMGGGFGGAIDEKLKSAKMAVDYVHVSSINGIGQVIQH
jgi:beta-glucanase (GH16 family)